MHNYAEISLLKKRQLFFLKSGASMRLWQSSSGINNTFDTGVEKKIFCHQFIKL